MDYTYKQDELVKFDYGTGLEGIGKIIGAVTSEFPIIGRVYMVEVLEATEKFPNDTYPFKTIPVIESQLDALTPYEL